MSTPSTYTPYPEPTSVPVHGHGLSQTESTRCLVQGIGRVAAIPSQDAERNFYYAPAPTDASAVGPSGGYTGQQAFNSQLPSAEQSLQISPHEWYQPRNQQWEQHQAAQPTTQRAEPSTSFDQKGAQPQVSPTYTGGDFSNGQRIRSEIPPVLFAAIIEGVQFVAVPGEERTFYVIQINRTRI